MPRRILFSLLSLFSVAIAQAQDVLLPLQMNAVLLSAEEEVQGLKSSHPTKIAVNIDSSAYILIDDFSYNTHVPHRHWWRDRSVYINRSFPVNPVTVGVATFDGMDYKGYPYNFFSPTSYGACDTLTSLPIELGNVRPKQDEPIYLTFYYQPQGISPINPGEKDSIALEFFQPFRYDTSTFNNGGVIDTTIDSTRVNKWIPVWGQTGYDLAGTDTSCNFAFRSQTFRIPNALLQDSFQFRFTTFGNTSGNVDQWHLDFVVMSSASDGHNELGDYAFRNEIGSLIEQYEAMPWFHYVGNESIYARSRRAKYKLRNTFGSQVSVDLLYRCDDENGNQVDSVTTVAVTSVNARGCKTETMPVTGDPLHTFVFPSSSAPANDVTHFLKKTVLKRRIGSADIIPENNVVESFQVFGTYYAYDDGTAEAGYGVKADDGRVAVEYILPPGITDTLTSIYIHFNPVVNDRSEQRFRLTVWDNNVIKPGDIIYESTNTLTPTYPKEGVNYFKRYWLDQPILVSDTFYVGYQKITGEPLNIGYDLNRKTNQHSFFSTGGDWIRSSAGGSVPNGSVMIRPSFRSMDEVAVGVKEHVDAKAEIETNIHLFPNPVNDNLTIKIDGGNDLQARVMSMDGRVMHEFRPQPFQQLNVGNYPSGLYILQVVDRRSGKVSFAKFLKN